MSENNGWETYSKLVLQQLETLSSGIEGLRSELQHVKEQLTELKAKEDRVQDLKTWKEKMDDIASPPQLKEALLEIEELKEFKTKSVTAFMVIQALMAGALALTNMIS
jgi:Tfp pilus assembly protein PilO|tara:strand:- start:1655 stop:1978 length:324 start_codon:yes stop_codon:yes gene_type:complete